MAGISDQIKAIQEGADPSRAGLPAPVATAGAQPGALMPDALRAMVGGPIGGLGPAALPPGLIERLLMMLKLRQPRKF